MELRQLKYLLTVVEEGSFTRAAARLHVAQPGVSAQIRQLEKELGEPLLDRTGRMVRPTEAGTAVLPHARAALEAVDAVRVSVDELTGLVRGHVRLGTVPSIASIDLPALLASFRREHPRVHVTLTEGAPDQLLGDLSLGRVDVVLVGAGPLPAGVAAQVVVDEALVAVVCPDDPLAEQRTIAVSALRDRPLISLPQGTGLRGCVEQACADAGFEPRIDLEAGDPRLITRLAARGLGIALVSESMARAHAAEVCAVALTRAPRARIQLGWRDKGPTSPAARALIGHARAVLPDLGPTAT